MTEYLFQQDAGFYNFVNGASGTTGLEAAVEFPSVGSSAPGYGYGVYGGGFSDLNVTSIHVKLTVDSGEGWVDWNINAVDPEVGLNELQTFTNRLGGLSDLGDYLTPGDWSWDLADHSVGLPYNIPEFLRLSVIDGGVDSWVGGQLNLNTGGPMSISRFRIVAVVAEPGAWYVPPLRQYPRDDLRQWPPPRNTEGSRRVSQIP